MKIYGSKLCSDCRKLKATLEANHISFDFIDITESLPALKAFLKYRYTEKMFDRFKEKGKIGIPFVILDDGTMFHDWESWCRESNIAPINPENGQACSINGKGC